jgi:allophanate hydrolase
MIDSSLVPGLDLPTLARHYRARDCSPREVISCLLTRIQAQPDPAIWIHLVPREKLLAQAKEVEKRHAAGEELPLYGVPFGVKDNIDVAGLPTTAACPAFTYVPQATAPVVSRLLDAGAILVGKTNLDQFATGLAGDRSPYGACQNVFAPDYISGGSSSGSAVAVAAGLVSFALGTDTAGSGRIPAGCNNIVGLKPTPGLFSTVGVVPACRSLDCVSVFSLTTDDAFQVVEAVLEKPWPDHPLNGAGEVADLEPGFNFATPRDADLEFFGDTGQEQLFHQTVEQLERAGSRRQRIDFRPFREVGELLYGGPWLAERAASIGGFLRRHPAAVHPVTRSIIERGFEYSGVDVFEGIYRLEALRSTCLKIFDQSQVLVVPTLPALPTRAETAGDSVGWSSRLGLYSSFVNLLRLAALSLPAGFTPRGLPGGLTVIGPAGSDRLLGTLGKAWQRRFPLPLGATGTRLPPGNEPPLKPPSKGLVRVAVAGAHLRDQPLHEDLLATGARFVRACRTAARYRFVALMDLAPPRPGLLRVDDKGSGVHVEIYDLPPAGFGRLVASVAPPLAIGTVELADGEAVKGFLCESFAAARARDITEFGGWIAFRDHQARSSPRCNPCC